MRCRPGYPERTPEQRREDRARLRETMAKIRANSGIVRALRGDELAQAAWRRVDIWALPMDQWLETLRREIRKLIREERKRTLRPRSAKQKTAVPR